MSSATNRLLAGAVLAVAIPCAAQAAALRVCADPNNLPYSNADQQGFENQIAGLIGKDFNQPVSYVWFRQGEKFFKRTLNAGLCDVVMGVPTGFDEAATTQPYYRSTYVFVSRRDRHLRISGFDDPQLRKLKIGVHVLGEADDSIPPVHALTSRGIVRNLVGFSIFGQLDQTNPAANLIRAVADRKVDVAIAWGPLAGYFARQSTIPLDVTPIAGDPTLPELPFHFDIAIGVREQDKALAEKLDAELTRRRPEIEQILRSFGVPQVTPSAASSSASISAHLTAVPQVKGD